MLQLDCIARERAFELDCIARERAFELDCIARERAFEWHVSCVDKVINRKCSTLFKGSRPKC